MPTIILQQTIAPGADLARVPGPVKVLLPIKQGENAHKILARERHNAYQCKTSKAKRDAKRAHCQQTQAALMAYVWQAAIAKLRDAPKVAAGGVDYIPLKTIAACTGLPHNTIYSRLTRMGMQAVRLPARYPLDRRAGLTLAEAVKITTFNPGHRQGWGNNPKRKKV